MNFLQLPSLVVPARDSLLVLWPRLPQGFKSHPLGAVVLFAEPRLSVHHQSNLG